MTSNLQKSLFWVFQYELVSSAKTRAPKWYFYNSAEILPEHRNGDRAKKMKAIALIFLYYYFKKLNFSNLTFLTTL